MTRRLVVATPETPLLRIAAMFDSHRIGRVTVVSKNSLVGIVACADLVKALASGPHMQPPTDSSMDDEHIHDQLLAELERQGWRNGRISHVLVDNGVVIFNAYVENEPQRRASRVAAESIAGARSVRDEGVQAAELVAMY
jgi:osmotically-inducible protein OsmY